MNKPFKSVVSIVIISILSVPALHAQDNNVMTLKDCMYYALERSTKVLSQKTQTMDARIDRRNAILTLFTPSVTFDGSGNYSWGRALDPGTNTYKTDTSFKNLWNVSAGMNLFDGFSAVNNYKIAVTSVSMGISSEQQEEDKICLATMEAYFNVLYYSQLLEIVAEQVQTAERNVQMAVRQEELGLKGHSDVVEMEAELADMEYNLINTQNSRDNAMITLQDVMLWPLDEELHIETNVEALIIPASQSTDADVVETALSTMPSIAIAQGQMRTAQLKLNTSKWRYLPTIGISGGLNTSYFTYPSQKTVSPQPYFPTLKTNSGEYLNLWISVPLYDRLNKTVTLKKNRNELERSALQLNQTKRDVESEVKRAIQDRDGAESAMQQAKRRSEVQDEAFMLNSKKYEMGLISPIEYSTASDNYLKAKAEYLGSFLKYQIKLRVVNYYNGVRYLDL